MVSLKDEIDIYRDDVISTIKEIKFIMRDINIKYATLVNSMCILQLYAVWEGFVFNTLEMLKTHIKNEVFDRNELNNQLYVLSINENLKKISGTPSFSKKVDVITKINNQKIDDIQFPLTDTSANVKNKVLRELFFAVGIENITDTIQDEMKIMDKYLVIRGKLAHGKATIRLTKTEVLEYSSTIVEVVDLIILKVSEYIDNYLYKKSS